MLINTSGSLNLQWLEKSIRLSTSQAAKSSIAWRKQHSNKDLRRLNHSATGEMQSLTSAVDDQYIQLVEKMIAYRILTGQNIHRLEESVR